MTSPLHAHCCRQTNYADVNNDLHERFLYSHVNFGAILKGLNLLLLKTISQLRKEMLESFSVLEVRKRSSQYTLREVRRLDPWTCYCATTSRIAALD